MASTITTTVNMGLSIVEALGASQGPFLNANKNAVTHDGLSISGLALNGTSNPAVTVTAVFKALLIAGALTIDLTALTHLGAALSANGLKVVGILVKAAAANANPIVLKQGVTNGHPLLGANWLLTLNPGETFLLYKVANGSTIAAGAKTWDMTGTGTQELDFEVIFGP